MNRRHLWIGYLTFYKSMAATQLPELLTSIINNACNFTRHSVAGFSVPEVVLRLGQLWSLVNHLHRTDWARKAQEVRHKNSIENLLIFKIKWADSWSYITLKQLKKEKTSLHTHILAKSAKSELTNKSGQAKPSSLEMLLVGFEAAWRMEPNYVTARMKCSCCV